MDSFHLLVKINTFCSVLPFYSVACYSCRLVGYFNGSTRVFSTRTTVDQNHKVLATFLINPSFTRLSFG